MKRAASVATSLLLLAVLIVGAWWIVKTKRPAGAMTPLEAQGMDMSVMKPPRGVFPVGAEAVRVELFAPTVVYPATIRAENEEVVRARVTGRLIDTKVYPGDRVRPGQALALIEPTEYAARSQEARGAVGTAEADSEQASAAISEADASLLASLEKIEQARAEVQEAQSLLAGAQAEQKAVEAEREQNAAESQAIAAEIEYWEAESARTAALLEKGFVSKRDAQMASTKLAQLREQLRSLRAMRVAIEARIEQSLSNRAAMQSRALRAEAMSRASEKEADAARARVSAAKAQRRKTQAAVAAQRGAASVAELYLGYSTITAQNEGVITERLLDPGTVAMAGDPIFRLQQDRTVRAQAKVSAEDAARIQAGFPVAIKRQSEPKRVYRAVVSTVFREADAASRTMIVEARLDNRDGRIAVGEYAEMEISLQRAVQEAITVPARSVQYDEGRRPFVWVLKEVPKDQAQTPSLYTCPMHPEIEQKGPGICPICKMDLVPKEIPSQFTAVRRKIVLGGASRDRAAVISGLGKGDRVIVFGFGSLVEGDPVFPTDWGSHGPGSISPPAFAPSESGGHKH
ncbi:MAG: efflux RND transporter periplasmic adaptor subunit [Armatimonadetes bacterium]|nr:efflux RND transporter periplasmic adaptor subunit [Armatimonadota bacterium]